MIGAIGPVSLTSVVVALLIEQVEQLQLLAMKSSLVYPSELFTCRPTGKFAVQLTELITSFALSCLLFTDNVSKIITEDIKHTFSINLSFLTFNTHHAATASYHRLLVCGWGKVGGTLFTLSCNNITVSYYVPVPAIAHALCCALSANLLSRC